MTTFSPICPGKTVAPFLFILISGLLCWISSPAQVLEFRTDVHLEADRVVEEITCFIQINNRDQDAMAELSINYSEEDELDILEASILDMAGKTVRTVGKKEITTRHDISRGTFFANSMVKEFTLKWNKYPYWIRYAYRTTTKQFVYACRWRPYFNSSIPKRSTLRVDYPASLAVNVLTTNDLTGDSSVVKGRIYREWQYAESKAFKKEILGPPLVDQFPRVIVAAEKFTYGVPGTLNSWSSFGEWQSRLNEGTRDLPPMEVMRVQNTKEKCPDKITLIRTLYHYLQDNTRYVNISLGDGGYKPFPASYVSANKYGDCKALTGYMQSQLEAAGIPSYYVKIVGDDSPQKFFRNLPGNQFNHIILCVPLGKDTVWLENTNNVLPTGYLGTFTQNREALLVDGARSRLVRTPALTAEQVLCRRSYAYTLNDEGSAMIAATWELRGADFESFKTRHNEQTSSDFRKAVEYDLPGRDYRLLDVSLEPADRDSPVVTIKLALETENMFRVLGRTRVLKDPIIGLAEFETPAIRTTEVILHYPINEEQVHRFTLPPGETGQVSLPKDIDLAGEFGRYKVSFQKNEQTIVVNRSLLLFAGKITLDKYPAFYQFIETIRASERKSPITITPKS